MIVVSDLVWFKENGQPQIDDAQLRLKLQPSCRLTERKGHDNSYRIYRRPRGHS